MRSSIVRLLRELSWKRSGLACREASERVVELEHRAGVSSGDGGVAELEVRTGKRSGFDVAIS